jgi:ABC-type nickel/cobalt efflux system permease component RcnA
VTVAPGSATVRYVLDYAEIPTVAERQAMGAAQTGAVSPATEAAYLKAQLPPLLANLDLTADGKRVPLSVQASRIEFRVGAGNLPTMRLVADLLGALPTGVSQLRYADGNYSGRTGWKEIVVKSGQGAQMSNPGALGQDISRELTLYPTDLLSAPPQTTDVAFAYGPVGAILPAVAPLASSVSAAPQMGGSETPRDRFTQAIISKRLTLPIILLGLVIAFVYGGLHALSPGHGKTMVAAYLVGQRGTVKHALLLGGVVTLTHTFGVFLLGFVTLFASRYIVPERLFPVLSVISGLAVFGVGVWMLVSRLRLGVPHEHSHSHGHDHGPVPERMQLAFATAAGQGMSHDDLHRLGLAHDHDHDHDHDHALGHVHDHMEAHEHSHDHGHHEHSHEGLDDHGGHSHGAGGYHTHTVPDGPITLKSLVALGISGGIVPCPSALVVLLSAIALHRLGYGMLLITAFSLGLASVLVAIGVLVVTARGWLDRIPSSGKAMRLMPIASAVGITVIGAVLVVQAVMSVAL